MTGNERLILFVCAIAIFALVFFRRGGNVIVIPTLVPEYLGYNASPNLTPQLTPKRQNVGGNQ